jgi:uncharacterized FAD-dependent dehydrogenase
MRYDAVIVGSGMAGLLAAHRLLRERPGAAALIVDAGPALDARNRYGTGEWGGYGGAGLFLGGRVYLGAATIPVLPPLSLPAGAHVVLEGKAYAERTREVNALLDRLGAHAPLRDTPNEGVTQAMERAAEAGLEYVTSYPARFLSIEERMGVLRALHDELGAAGVGFRFGAPMTAIARTVEGYRLTLGTAEAAASEDTAQSIETRALLLAPGRYGAEWLVRVAGELGAGVVPLAPAFGVRIEVPRAAYAPLTDVNPDPRLQRTLEDADAMVKTYATCPGGIVTAVERYGRLVASGVPLMGEERTPNTTFAVLVQPGVRGAAERWRGGEASAALLNERAPGRLVVQRLADMQAGRATMAAALAANSIAPTNRAAQPGALHDAYPDAYWRAFEDLLARIERLAPGVATGDTLLYGPAEERFWYFPTDERLQTTLPGLFVAGDGPGQSQGIVQAAVTGLLAGEGLARHLAG